MEYEQSWKEYNDWFAVLSTAEKKGEKIGIEKGGKIEIDRIAINAIKKGFDNQTIQELTGLSIQEIDVLRKQISSTDAPMKR